MCIQFDIHRNNFFRKKKRFWNYYIKLEKRHSVALISFSFSEQNWWHGAALVGTYFEDPGSDLCGGPVKL